MAARSRLQDSSVQAANGFAVACHYGFLWPADLQQGSDRALTFSQAYVCPRMQGPGQLVILPSWGSQAASDIPRMAVHL